MKAKKQNKRSVARESLADQSIPVMIGLLGALVGWVLWLAVLNTLQPAQGFAWLDNLTHFDTDASTSILAGSSIGVTLGGWIRSIMLGSMREELKQEKLDKEEALKELQLEQSSRADERQRAEKWQEEMEKALRESQQREREDRAKLTEAHNQILELVKRQTGETGTRGYSRKRRRPGRFATRRNQANSSQPTDSSTAV